MKSIAQQIDGADSLQSRLITALGIKKAIGQPASIMVIYRYYAKSEEKHL